MKRCGYCGYPTDDNANPIPMDEANKLTQKELDNLDHIEGNCCHPNNQPEAPRRVTKEMANDAGMPEIEGWRI